MKHLTLFLSICWVFWFSQIFAISTICGLSDIPAASVIALGNNVSELVSETLTTNDSKEFSSTTLSVDTNTNNSTSSNIIKNENPKSKNDFIVLSEVKNTIELKNSLQDNISSDENKKIIDDSGGTLTETSTKKIEKEIIREEISSSDDSTSNLQNIPQEPSSTTQTTSTSSTKIVSEVNLTTEENPIPVFSEWAQKQMEEAEKKLEKQVVNTSSSKKNTTTGNKPTLIKLRAKNYASPDCGAKIIASNSEAQNTGALLSSSKDEYMLSPCTNRIWFVIELCEAIQLEKVNLANFELFSSSPKNFSVAVSSRFPTREWSNVGRFIAEDNRQIQSFDLYPHLFGKFVRVDVHSHYNSEHFCPISLFHVYGTSEFEAFETENRQQNDNDDDDEDDYDEFQQQHHQHGDIKIENNLFKSASDAVMSIVKKAAEVLVKTNTNKTQNNNIENNLTNLEKTSQLCYSPIISFACEKCNQTFINSVNDLLTCKYLQLIDLLKNHNIRNILSKSFTCNRILNRLIICDLKNNSENCEKRLNYAFKEKNTFLLNILPLRYQVALCHLMNTIKIKNNTKFISDKETPLNLTIDKKYENEFIKFEKQLHSKKQKQHETDYFQKNKNNDDDNNSRINQKYPDIKNDENNKKKPNENGQNEFNEETQIPEPPINNEYQTENIIENIEPTENVNIFNIVNKYNSPSSDSTVQQQQEKQQHEIENDKKQKEESMVSTSTTSSSESSEKIEETSTAKTKDTENEQGTWEENIDNLLSEQSSDNLNSNSNLNNEGSQAELQTVQRVQSESIFIRLSNRIKALERNMSLSGQYLEELSRRYKKQVEELQYSFTKTLSAIEEQNRNAQERENILTQQYKNLEENVTELTIRFNSLIICLIPLIVFQFIVSWIFIRSYRRRYLDLVQRFEENVLINNGRQQRQTKKSKKLSRRKSIEGGVINEKTTKPIKIRRPSEEAMRVSSGSYKDLLILDNEIKENSTTSSEQSNNLNNSNNNNKKLTSKQRQRKLSVFYGKPTNQNLLSSSSSNKSNNQNFNNRLESVSEDLTNFNVTLSTLNSNDELILDDDYENYIPGTDLAYNEFMPDGPSGNENKKINENLSSISSEIENISQSKSKKLNKFHKLASPKFLKSPFNKNDDNKKLSHRSTGWEWYRSKKSIDSLIIDKSPSSISSNDGELKQFLSTSTIENLEKINGNLLRLNNHNHNSGSSSKSSNESMRLSSNEISTISTTPITATTDSQFNKNGNSLKKRSSFRKILKKVF